MSFVRSFVFVGIICTACFTANAQLAYVTFLNNCLDVDLKSVDLYVTQQGITIKFEDIAFQQAVNLDPIFGDLQATLKVAPGSSTDVSQSFVSHDFLPKTDSGYVAMVSGVRAPALYAPNPDSRSTAVALTTFRTVLTIPDPSKTGFYTVHGSTDLEAFDVYFRGNAVPLASNLAFGDRTQAPVSVARSIVTVDVTKAGDKTKVLGSFALNIPGLSSEVVVLVVSGFKTPGDNNGSTDSLALLAILENGLVVRSPLIAGSQTARVQVVNNLPEFEFTRVDIWLKNESLGAPTKKIDNLAFRGATGFIEFPSGTPFELGIAPSTSTLFRDTIFTDVVEALRPGRSYTFILTGVDGSGYMANPERIDTSARVAVLENALELPAQPDMLAVRAGNFTTDAGPLSIFGREQFIADASYLEAAPEYVHVQPARDTIWIRDETTGARLKGYECTPCEQSRAMLVLTSGFKNPDSNNTGQPLRLIFVLADGTVIANAKEIDTATTSAVDDFEANGSADVRSYPNPTYGDVTVVWGSTAASGAGARVHVYDAQGNLLLSSAFIAPGTQRISLPTAGLPSGVHIARVISPDGTPIGSTSFSILK